MRAWGEDRHWQADWGRWSAWVGLRRRSWIVGVQGSLHDPADAPAVAVSLMLGPLYVGLEVLLPTREREGSEVPW